MGVRRLENTLAPEGRAVEDSNDRRGRGRSVPEGRPTGEPMTSEQVERRWCALRRRSGEDMVWLCG